MRKITNNAVNAFLAGKEFKSSNTTVENNANYTLLKLHGNVIAKLGIHQKTLSITNAGWFTNTTKERLNALPNVNIQQKRGVWYLNGKVWDGKLIDIK